MKKLFTTLFLAVLACNAHAQGVITTVAGIGTQSYSGDGGPAVDAGIDGPYSVICDNAGNFYIADGYNSRIRKVDTSGTITTIAGIDTEGYNGDNIAATNAAIYRPVGMALDSSDNLYFVDALNNRIRRIDAATGIITTVAGNGSAGYNGDGIAAGTAMLNNPHGVAIDNTGNLLITDFGNYRVRKVDNTGIITTIAGTGISGYSGDGNSATSAEVDGIYGIAVDNIGNIYFSDIYKGVVRKVDNTGIITTFAGLLDAISVGDGGPADSAKLAAPAGIEFDIRNNLYIAEEGRVRKVSLTTNTITTVTGNGTMWYSGDGGPATAAEVSGAAGVSFDRSGNLYISDFGNNRIRKVTPPEGVPVIVAQSFNVQSYPNPATDIVYITLPYTIQQGTLSIQDISGKEVMTIPLYGTSAQVDVLRLTSGVYVLKITDNIHPPLYSKETIIH